MNNGKLLLVAIVWVATVAVTAKLTAAAVRNETPPPDQAAFTPHPEAI
jgi:hypothetical protein